MSKQCNFFASKNDLIGFVDILNKEDVDVIENKIYDGSMRIEKIKAIDFDFSSITSFCFLIPSEISIDILKFSSANGKIFLRSTDNPIIEFKPSKINNNNKLELGRIYLDYQDNTEVGKSILRYFNFFGKYFKKWKSTSKYKYWVGPDIYNEILLKKVEMATLDSLN